MLGRFCRTINALPNKSKLLLGFAALFVPATLIGVAGLLGVRLNLTNSVPIGLYVISNSPEASLVEFCPPEPFGTLSRERGYRERSRFGCSDGAKPLLKPVAARAGDVVAITAAGIAVDGRLVPHTAPLHFDSAGRPISSWPFGVYPVRRGRIWVVSSFNAHSFDSRYFGPVSESAVLHRLRPLWTTE